MPHDQEFYLWDFLRQQAEGRFDLTDLTSPSVRIWKMPNFDGHVPLLETTNLWDNSATFSSLSYFLNGVDATGISHFRGTGGSPAELFIYNGAGTFHSDLTGSAFTANRVLTIPDKTGTIAITSDIVTQTSTLLSASIHTDTATGTVVLGDLIHGNATPKWDRLAGNTTTTKKYLSQTGNGTISAVPSWSQPASTELSDTAGLARLATAQIFTKANTITPDSDATALRLTIPTGATSNGFEIYDVDQGGLTYLTQAGGSTKMIGLVIGPVGFAFGLVIQSKTAVSANRIYSIDNSITSTDFMMTGGTQTSTGAKTFSGASFFTGAGGANMDGTTAKFIFRDQTTPTKTMSFDLSGITAANHRGLKIADKAGTVMVTDDTSPVSYSLKTATVNFGSTGAEQATVTVTDANVRTASMIIADMAYVAPPDSRDLDELEMDQFTCVAGNIVNATSFDILVTCLTGIASGQYTVNYVRS
jgi:hypothetical protein